MAALVDIPERALKLLVALRRSSPRALSGVEIGDRFGVSRTAVWKWVETLRSLGYVIQSSRRDGYQLAESVDRPYPWEVIEGLYSTRFGHSVHYFPSISSTQDEARRLAEEGVEEGTVVVAEEQVVPRGRLGRAYCTPPGGLWLSLVLRPRRSPGEVGSLPLLAAVAVGRAVQEVTGLEVTVKWPNDLLLKGRKVVGVLVELMSEQDLVRYAIVGIGVNVNLMPSDLPPELRNAATSLKEEVGSEVSRLILFRRIMERMEELYDQHMECGAAEVIKAWRSLPTILGEWVEVDDGADKWEGEAVDLDKDGALLVRVDGKLRRVVAGDIRLRTARS